MLNGSVFSLCLKVLSSSTSSQLPESEFHVAGALTCEVQVANSCLKNVMSMQEYSCSVKMTGKQECRFIPDFDLATELTQQGLTDLTCHSQQTGIEP